MTRLVSVYYEEFYPFHTTGLFDTLSFSNDPDSLKENDVLLVWGGNDIHPSFYNKKHSAKSGAAINPSKRDMVEWLMMDKAVLLGIPIIGVCRGAQMACARAGGYLIQHVNGHGGYHNVVTKDGDILRVNSLHHQMMQAAGVDHELLAHTEKKHSNEYWDEDSQVDVDIEPEYIYFNKIKAHAVQWHPEMMDSESPATKYLLNKIKEYM